MLFPDDFSHTVPEHAIALVMTVVSFFDFQTYRLTPLNLFIRLKIVSKSGFLMVMRLL